MCPWCCDAALGVLLAMSALFTPSGQPSPLQKGEVILAGPSRLVSWQMKRLAPPSSLYITTDDVLRVSAASSQANEAVTVSYRVLRAFDGAIVYGQFQVSPGSNRAAVAQDQPTTEGFLLSASCQAAIATTRGQTFVRLFLNPKALGAGQPAQMLMADYVTTAMAPGYPNGRVLAPSEGPGNIRGLTVAPAANAEVSFAVPTNARWRVMGGVWNLVTDATAGNRSTEILAFIGGAFVLDAFKSNLIASLTFRFNLGSTAFGETNAGGTGQDTIFIPLPPSLVFLASSTLSTSTTFVGAADRWTAQLLVEEWLDNV